MCVGPTHNTLYHVQYHQHSTRVCTQYSIPCEHNTVPWVCAQHSSMGVHTTLFHGCAHNTLPRVCTQHSSTGVHTTLYLVMSSPHYSSYITFFPPALVSSSTPFSIPRERYKQNINASQIIQNAYAQATCTHLPNKESITTKGSLLFVHVGRHQ